MAVAQYRSIDYLDGHRKQTFRLPRRLCLPSLIPVEAKQTVVRQYAGHQEVTSTRLFTT